MTAGDGTSTSLFAHLYNPNGMSLGWSLLIFDGRRTDVMSQLQSAVAEVRGWDWIRPRLVPGAGNPTPDGPTVLSDLDGHAHAAYGVDGRAALILVRPDGHIAFRGPAEQPELLSAYCRRVFDPVSA